jgi:8-oxo-dGTP pyrophosphatase MutT (NUDIX family)
MPNSAPSDAHAKMPATVRRVARLDLTFAPRRWEFAEARRAEIDAHFAEQQRAKPELWNGRVLLGRNPAFSDDCFSAQYFETDFASFLAWRDWGFPDGAVFNGFGMGALYCDDGCYVLGQMGDHTANAGRVYFPAGTPDPDDLRGSVVDIPGSVARETEEETGLSAADYRAADHWDCVVTKSSVAMIRMLHVATTGEALRARIEATLAGQTLPELSAIHLVRDAADVTPAMSIFVTAFFEARLGAGKARPT